MDEVKLLNDCTELMRSVLQTVPIVDKRIIEEYIKVVEATTESLQQQIVYLQLQLDNSTRKEYRDPRHEMGQ